MHIVVCIKQVPDSAQIRVHPVTNTIMRQGVPTIINPYDLFALEEALRLRDKVGGLSGDIMPAPAVSVAASGGEPGAASDAISALVNLGYRRADASGAVSRAARKLGTDAGIDALIRGGLKELTS